MTGIFSKGRNAQFCRMGGVFRRGKIGSQFNTQISPIAYLKVVRGEAYSYGLAQHYAGGHTFALASGSPALPTGLSLAADGTLSGTATVANMDADFTIRATNTISGLAADAIVPVSVAQRPGDFALPTLTELSSTSLRVTKPANPANTPAVTSVVMLHGPTIPLTTANGTQVFNAFPGAATTNDITGLQAGSTRYVTLKARTFWKDGAALDAAAFSPNVASIVLSGANTAPSYTAPPTISPTTGPAGTVFTLAPGTVSGQPTPASTLIGMTQNGVDVLGQVSGNSFTSTAQGPLVATWQATNGVAPNATAQATATITAAAQVPTAMAAPGLAVVSASQIDATVAAAPADGGSAITSYEMRYSLDQVNWTVITGLSAGETRGAPGLLSSTTYYFQNAARNAVGLGPWSASASATTNAASGTTITFGQFTAVGAGAKAIAEANGTYGQFTVAAGIITPNASPLAVGTVVIGTTNVTVVASEYSVASKAEFEAARTNMGAAGGRTLRFRAGTHAMGADYVLANTAYAARITITGETGAILTGNFDLQTCSNVTVQGLDLQWLATTPVPAYVLVMRGVCVGTIITQNKIHGVHRDPLGDYSAGGYSNPEGIGSLNSGGYINGVTITRNEIYDVWEAIVLQLGGPATSDISDNEFYWIYEDYVKLSVRTAGLTAIKRINRNYGHDRIGDPADAQNPHLDCIQFVGNVENSGLDMTNIEILQNVFTNTSATRSKGQQGITNFLDGAYRAKLKNPRIVGNFIQVDGNHPLTIMCDGGLIAHNTFVKGPEADGTTKTDGDCSPEITVNGAAPTLLRNIWEDTTGVFGTSVLTDNLIIGDKGAINSYASTFDGPTYIPASFANVKTMWNRKAAGPADVGYGRGSLGTGIGTYGSPRDPSGWTYNAAYEQVTPSTLTTISISEPQLPVYDSNPFFGGQAAVTFTVTHDTGAGDTLQYRIVNGDTAAVIQDWTDFAATTGSTPLTINRGPSFTPLKIAVRGKVQTGVTDTQATKWWVGLNAVIEAQSLGNKPWTNSTTVGNSFTPPDERLWILYNDVSGGIGTVGGSLATGPRVVNASSIIGARRAAAVVNAYCDGPVLLVDCTESGTGRNETWDAEEAANRSWALTEQNPVDYIRSRGSDIGLVLEHWFTNEASAYNRLEANSFHQLARHFLPGYTKLQEDGLLNTPNGTGVQNYSGAQVQVSANASYHYTPIHHFFALNGQAGGLFDPARTRWTWLYGMSATANSGTRADGVFHSVDMAKGGTRRSQELWAEAESAWLPITLRSLPGWSGQASWGGHMAMPDGTHVAANDPDGESLVACHIMIAIMRALGKLPRAEPRVTSVTWAASGSKATVRVSLPNGGNLSTAYIQHGAGAYAGSYEATNWQTPAVLPETSVAQLHNVQGFAVYRSGAWLFSGFTATIVNTGTGTGAARYGEIDIVPNSGAFVNGDQILFGYADGQYTLNPTDLANCRPHIHWPLETRAHVSGTGYGWPVVREAGTTSISTAAGINGGATAPSAFVSGQWTLTDPGTDGDLTVTVTALPSDGGSALTAIQYQADGGNWISFGAATVGTYTISGLTNNVSHAVILRAINSVGAGSGSDTKNQTPTAANVPSAFTAGMWTLTNPDTDGDLTVTISSLPSNGGAAINDLQRRVSGGAWVSLGGTGTGAYTISGLSNGVSVPVEIRAQNAVGAGAASDTKNQTPTGTVAPTFFTHGTYFASPTNTPAGTTNMKFKARLKMPTHPSAIAFLFTQASTGCDLTTLATNRWKVVAENSGGTSVLNVSSAISLPPAGAWVIIEYEVDQTAGTATVKHDGATVLSASVTTGGTFQSNRKVSMLGGTTGTSLWPDCEVEYLEVYYNGSLHKRIDASAGIAAINADTWQLGGDVT